MNIDLRHAQVQLLSSLLCMYSVIVHLCKYLRDVPYVWLSVNIKFVNKRCSDLCSPSSPLPYVKHWSHCALYKYGNIMGYAWFTISRFSGNSIYSTHETIFIQSILYEYLSTSIVQFYCQGQEYWHLLASPMKMYVLESGMLSWYCLWALVVQITVMCPVHCCKAYRGGQSPKSNCTRPSDLVHRNYTHSLTYRHTSSFRFFLNHWYYWYNSTLISLFYT